MSNFSDTFGWLPPARDIAAILLDAGVKSAAVLAAAALAVVCMKRRSAAARHLVCFLAVAALPVLPLLSWALPGWRVLPQWLDLREPPRVSISSTSSTSSTPSTPSPIPPIPRQAALAAPALPELSLPAQIPSPAFQPVPAPKPPPVRAKWDPWRAGLLAWLAGALLALTPPVLGMFSLRLLERASRRETASSWLDLLAQLLTRLRFRRRVVLLSAAQRRMPMTWGVLRPRVLLPAESQQWPQERRSVVLLHELAHAQRCDYLTLLITRLVCALYWFNPLVWLAARRMIAERERACDDIVLRHGADPADYAEQVLEISAGLSADWLAGYGAVAMARPSNLESRLRAILDPKRNRAAVTRTVVVSALLLLTAILVPVAMLKAASGSQSPNPQPAAPKQSDGGSAIRNPQSEWGEPAGGLRTRLVAEKNEFRAGEPIRIRIEVTNTSDQNRTFQRPAAPYNDSLIVLDANGRATPFIQGGADVAAARLDIASRQSVLLKSFDLTEWYYLRRPGAYTVQLPAERFLMRVPGEAAVLGLPLSGKLTFEVVADPKASAETDPDGRLLLLSLERAWLAGKKLRERVRPGSNRKEVFGSAVKLDYIPPGIEANAGIIWVWRTEEPAAERPVPADDPAPASEYMGRAGAGHIYLSVPANVLKGWPTAKEDILRAARSSLDFHATTGSDGAAGAISNPADTQSVLTGGTAVFTVSNTGTAPFAYQWQVNGVNLTVGNGVAGSSTNPPSAAATDHLPKSPETVLAEIRAILPEDWTCELNLKPGGTGGTLDLAKEPLFEIDFTNFNISYTNYLAGGSNIRPLPPHPCLRLYFLPAAERDRVRRGTNGIWYIANVAAIAVAETPDYLVVTSFRSINDGVGSNTSERSIAPLGFALEKYFGKLAYPDTGEILGMTAESSEGLTTGIGFAGRVVDDQTAKPVKEFSLEYYLEADPAAAEPVRSYGPVYFGGRFMLQFLQTNSAWEAVEFFGGGSSFRGLTKLAAGQKMWPRIRADGYFTQPLTPEPVVWPVKLTNLVVRLKRTDASSVPLAPGGTGR